MRYEVWMPPDKIDPLPAWMDDDAPPPAPLPQTSGTPIDWTPRDHQPMTQEWADWLERKYRAWDDVPCIQTHPSPTHWLDVEARPRPGSPC